jgi:hypothetical protein
MYARFVSLKDTITELGTDIDDLHTRAEQLDDQSQNFTKQLEDLEAEEASLRGIAASAKLDVDKLQRAPPRKATHNAMVGMYQNGVLARTAAEVKHKALGTQLTNLRRIMESLEGEVEAMKGEDFEQRRIFLAGHVGHLRSQLKASGDDTAQLSGLVQQVQKELAALRAGEGRPPSGRNSSDAHGRSAAAAATRSLVRSASTLEFSRDNLSQQLGEKQRYHASGRKQVWLLTEQLKLLRERLATAVAALPGEVTAGSGHARARSAFQVFAAQEAQKRDETLLEELKEQQARTSRRYESDIRSRDELLDRVTETIEQTAKQTNVLALRCVRMLVTAVSPPVDPKTSRQHGHRRHDSRAVPSPVPSPAEQLSPMEETVVAHLTEARAYKKAADLFGDLSLVNPKEVSTMETDPHALLDKSIGWLTEFPELPGSSDIHKLAEGIVTHISGVRRSRPVGGFLASSEIRNAWRCRSPSPGRRARSRPSSGSSNKSRPNSGSSVNSAKSTPGRRRSSPARGKSKSADSRDRSRSPVSRSPSPEPGFVLDDEIDLPMHEDVIAEAETSRKRAQTSFTLRLLGTQFQ